jgi:hypothetical protein
VILGQKFTSGGPGARMATSKAADIRKFIEPYLVVSGKKFQLKDHDPQDTHHLHSEDKPEGKKLVEQGVKMLAELQEIRNPIGRCC